MENVWSLQTHGDPLGKVRDLIAMLWVEASLTGMLVTVIGQDGKKSTPRYITDRADLSEINPFVPLMEINIARLVPGLLADHPGSIIGVLLRPCEHRALIEMHKHSNFNMDNLLTISVDCLGTLPADEYQWRLDRMGKNLPAKMDNVNDTSNELAREALKFARQGGIVPYRYRSACQVCVSPAAEYAAINIHVFGLPVRQEILLTVSDPDLGQRLNLASLADGMAESEQIQQHERLIARMNERHHRSMERIETGLGSMLPSNVDALIHQLEGCGECQSCLDVCPICSVDRPDRSPQGHYDRQAVMRWLVSCAGCGMCEQACPNHLPMASIFAHIRQQLDEEWQYTPGRSRDDALPLL